MLLCFKMFVQFLQSPPAEGRSHGRLQSPPADGRSHGRLQSPPAEGRSHGRLQSPPVDGRSHGRLQSPPAEGRSYGRLQSPPADWLSRRLLFYTRRVNKRVSLARSNPVFTKVTCALKLQTEQSLVTGNTPTIHKTNAPEIMKCLNAGNFAEFVKHLEGRNKVIYYSLKLS